MTELNEMQQKFIAAETEKLISLNDQKNEYLKLSTLTADQFTAFKSLLKQIETAQGKIAFASQPVDNTPERVDAIDKFINSIEIEVDMPETEDRKPITDYDIFVSTLTNYREKLAEHNQVLEDQLACTKDILNLMEAYLEELNPNEVSDALSQRIESERKIKDDLTVALECNTERLAYAEEICKKILANYDLLSDINFFLNNPLNMPDYEERVKAVSSIL